MITYECGCVNDYDRGLIKSILKCDYHKSMQRDIGELGEDYYRENGVMDPEAPVRYREQFEEALGPIERPRDNTAAMEVGAGASRYVPMITEAGWDYHACEPSRWARQWMVDEYGVSDLRLSNATWEDYGSEFAAHRQFGMIFSAHSLEHMIDAPAAVVKMAAWLEPGGVLYLTLPDDTDGCNPDHLWFFNRISLKRCLESAGLLVEAMEIRRYIPRENFLYFKARKPK